MKTAEVLRLEGLPADASIEEISERLDNIPDRIMIETLNWKSYDYKPEVSVALAWNDNDIFIKYFVRENWFKAEMTETNQMVCEDSCVEFFVSPGEDGIYYNLEFNGIGTCLLGSGTGRENSTRVDPEIVRKIRRISTAGNKAVSEREGEYSWSLTAAIPLGVFFRHAIGSLRGKTFRANFYKCGDKLTVPHYVTWNPVATENPDYHRPEYFGILKFI